MFPSTLRVPLINDQRPSPAIRRELVRFIAGEILSACESPSKKDTSIVASKLCERFPNTFGDFALVGGDIEAASYALSKQLKARIENLNRSKPTHNMKRLRRKINLDSPNELDSKSSYGCPNWMPNNPPNGHTLESLELLREKLFIHFNQAGPEGEDPWVEAVMKETFFLQRKDINGNQPIEIIKGRWPCLVSIKHYFNQIQYILKEQYHHYFIKQCIPYNCVVLLDLFIHEMRK